MTRKSEFGTLGIYVPEPIFMFATVFLRDESGKLVWTLSEDRKEEGKWVPPGGEIEIPVNANPYDLLDFISEALRETWEEVGVTAALKPKERFLPFNVAMLLNTHSEYSAEIVHTKKEISVKREGAHTLIFQVEAQIIHGKPHPMAEPSEPRSQTIEVKTLSLEESLKQIESGELKTYPTIINGLKILKENQDREKKAFWMSVNADADPHF